MEKIILVLSEKWIDLNWFLFVGVFIAHIILDWAWASYTVATAKLKPFRAANISMLIYGLGAFGVIIYTENFLYVFPTVLGAWLGTYFSILGEKKEIKKHDIK